MIVEVDPASPVPPYEQIRIQIERMAGTALLPSGTRLPTIRQLAHDLGVANGTVARAYRELESDGVIVTQGRHGTIIADRPRPGETQRLRQLTDAAAEFALIACQLGASPQEAVAAVRDALAAPSHRQT